MRLRHNTNVCGFGWYCCGHSRYNIRWYLYCGRESYIKICQMRLYLRMYFTILTYKNVRLYAGRNGSGTSRGRGPAMYNICRCSTVKNVSLRFLLFIFIYGNINFDYCTFLFIACNKWWILLWLLFLSLCPSPYCCSACALFMRIICKYISWTFK